MPVPPNEAQIASVWVAIGASVISLMALVIAILSLRTARRSAAAAERNVSIAGRDEDRRVADRRDALGPRFEPATCTYGSTLAHIKIRMIGGPGAARLTVAAHSDIEWLSGFTAEYDPDGQRGENPFVINRAYAGQDLEFTACLRFEPTGGERAVILPLTVTATYDEQVGEWVREVPVPLGLGPRFL